MEQGQGRSTGAECNYSPVDVCQEIQAKIERLLLLLDIELGFFEGRCMETSACWSPQVYSG